MTQTKAPIGARIKAAFQMVFGTAGGSYSSRYGRAWDNYPGSYYPGSTVDYSQVVGSPWHNSAVSICLGWIADNLPQARIRVTRDPGKGEPEEVKPHLLTDLLRRPNHAYSGRHLLAATAVSRCVSGDAYWMKARSSAGFGKPVELWHVPFWMITPQWDQNGSEFITSYLYRPDGSRQYTLKTTDVVHFRAGLDPENNRLGWSPLKAILREIATDNEIASYTRALLTNLGVPGAVMSPRDPAQVIPEDARKEIEDTYAAKFTKDNRGRAMVVSRALNVEKPAFSPEEMALDRIAKRPEARICAALKIPAMVVGLNVADETRTFSNWGEARSSAWEECIIPMLGDICETLDTDLLSDLGNADAEDVAPDYSKVRALQEDQDAISARATREYQGGGLMLNEYRQKIGQPEVDGGKVFFIPKGGELVKEEDLTSRAEATLAPPPGLLPDSGGDAGVGGWQEPGMIPATNGNGRQPALPAKAYSSSPVGFRREESAAKAWVTLGNGDHVFIGEGGGTAPARGRPQTIQRPQAPEPDAGKTFVAENAPSIGAKLSDPEREAVENYTTYLFDPINRALRSGGDLGQDKADVGHLDAAIAKSKTDRPMDVYRGLNVPAIAKGVRDGSIVGKVITDQGFMSTSHAAHVTRFFGGGEDRVLMRVHLPKGASALPAAAASRTYGDMQGEIILPRGSQLKVTAAHKMSDGSLQLEAEYL